MANLIWPHWDEFRFKTYLLIKWLIAFELLLASTEVAKVTGLLGQRVQSSNDIPPNEVVNFKRLNVNES